MNKIYGYARISRKQQSIDRHIRNIRAACPDVHIVQEAYTGRTMQRPEWDKWFSKVSNGDTIIFDSVSRMSRSADDGVQTYFQLMDRGVSLVFLKEPYINTATYIEASQQSIQSTGNEIADIYVEASNKVIKLQTQVRKDVEYMTGMVVKKRIILNGRGSRTRTCECWIQNPVPYQLGDSPI